ncbi:MAG TPA: PhnD/SsuA/transferrin family substrate-binding protein [Planctomycetota bacterium]|jgi:phosphonate transport system substrate-binding protein
MRWLLAYGLVAVAILLLAHSILATRQIAATVKLDSPPLSTNKKPDVHPQRLRIVVAPITLPVRGFAGYQALANYLAVELKQQTEVIYRDTYAQVNAVISNDHADVGFICLGGYWADPSAMDLLAATVIKGKTEYSGLIIVPQNGPIFKFADLRGRTFLFTDADSNTGHLYPLSLIRKITAQTDEFFSATKFTGGHDRSIQAIAWGLADGAAVSSAAFDVTLAQEPTLGARIRTIERSEPYPSPPVVVRKNFPTDDRQRLLKALTALPDTERGKSILTGLGIDGFSAAIPDIYKQSEPQGRGGK